MRYSECDTLSVYSQSYYFTIDDHWNLKTGDWISVMVFVNVLRLLNQKILAFKVNSIKSNKTKSCANTTKSHFHEDETLCGYVDDSYFLRCIQFLALECKK